MAALAVSVVDWAAAGPVAGADSVAAARRGRLQQRRAREHRLTDLAVSREVAAGAVA